MEALNMLKFWRISTALDESNDEDSFFDCPKYTPTTTRSFSRSPPKFPVMMLFKKSKCGDDSRKSKSSKVKCESGEEKIRISSILQGLSYTETPNRNFIKSCKKQRFILGGKHMVTRYVKLIKPLLLYVRVSRRRRQDERVKLFSDVKTKTTTAAAAAVSFRSPQPPRRKSADEKHDDNKVSKQYLRKSRSASSAVGLVRDPARRDDTLMEQHEGIQAAILHCKRSFTR